MTSGREILRVEGLNVWVGCGKEAIEVVHDASFTVRQGERWGVAGESGAGKSMTMNAITALLPRTSTRIEGRILYRLADGSWCNLMDLSYRKRHAFVSQRVAMIFQDSIHALNPNERIEKQWGDTVRLHHPRLSSAQRKEHLLLQMETFGIRGGEKTLRCYPNQLSGGMRQRIAIALALESQTTCEEEVRASGKQTIGLAGDTSDSLAGAGESVSPFGIIIADEPTTSLDSVTQRSVVEYIGNICQREGKTLLYVSHNLAILQHLCDKLMVFKDGRIVEQGDAHDLFFFPKHPYTREIVRETVEIMGVGDLS